MSERARSAKEREGNANVEESNSASGSDERRKRESVLEEVARSSTPPRATN